MININKFFLNKIILKIYQKIKFFLYKDKIIFNELQDISEYLSLSTDIIKKRALIKNTFYEDKLWNEKKRDTINDYRDYYSLNYHYLERQDYFNTNHINLLSEFRNLKKNANILDYGCGSASVVLKAKKKRKDLNIFLADIPEAITKNYAIWRFKKYKLNYIWIDIPQNEKIKVDNKFDLIRCHDVFEHTFQPLNVINIFYNSLNKDGLITFDYIENKKVEKEVTEQSQKMRPEVLTFVKNNFKILYYLNNKFVVKKISE